MSEFLQLIEENSVDLALQLLREKGNKVSNAKNEDGVSALMLATEVEPASSAILLIGALMKAIELRSKTCSAICM
jgi:ankyrin repeat protein